MWSDRHFNIYLNRPVYELNRSFEKGGVSAVESFAARYGITTVILLSRSSKERLLEKSLRDRGHPITQAGEVSILDLEGGRSMAPSHDSKP